MANQKRQYDLSRVQSSKTIRIIKDAASVAESLDQAGQHRMATAVDNLIRSRLASHATNSVLAADLRAAIASQS